MIFRMLCLFARRISLNMPQPLLDRMEIIRLSGYTEDEKVEIAKRHLIDKLTKDHGLRKLSSSISDDALRDILRYYTREAGVRNLERQIATLARKAIKEILAKGVKTIHITRRNLEKYLGVKKYRYGEVEADDLVGVTTGLAWTEVGGELLTIEAVALPGKGKITITGTRGHADAAPAPEADAAAPPAKVTTKAKTKANADA